MAGLKRREQAGIAPPRTIVEESIGQVEGHLHMQGSGSFDLEAIEPYASFREKLDQVENMSAEEKQDVLDAARTQVEQTFVPAFVDGAGWPAPGRWRGRSGQDSLDGGLAGGEAV